MYNITQMDGLQETKVKMMDIFLPIHAITEALVGKYDVAASDLTSLLLSTYILTGRYTVSYLYRRGKRRAYTTAIKHLTDLIPLCRYGDPKESLDVQEEVITAARRYIVSLYDRSDFGGNLDALRAHLFVSLKGDMRCLPPRCLTLTHQLKMPSYYTFAEPCISWLCVSGHTWFSQPTQLPLILGDLSMANWWQP